MKNKKSLIISLVCIAAFANATESSPDYKRFSGSYSIYGGTLDDRQAPKNGDRKISFEIEKNVAKEIFDTIGPDRPGTEVCAEKGERVRRKGQLECRRSSSAQYTCYFGFDLTTGKNINAIIC